MIFFSLACLAGMILAEWAVIGGGESGVGKYSGAVEQ